MIFASSIHAGTPLMKATTRDAQAIIEEYMRICDGNNEIRKNMHDNGTINSNISLDYFEEKSHNHLEMPETTG